MTKLADRIAAEVEYRAPDRPSERSGKPAGPDPDRLREARAVLEAARSKGGRIALAYSGGADSSVVLDLAARAGLDMDLVWTDSGMEYPDTRRFIEARAAAYRLPLAVAKAPRTPEAQWRLTGWPMLGKLAARNWTAAHPDAGFALNVSECCRTMKIRPGRTLTRNLGCTVQVTGQRGKADDRIRAFRAVTDGALTYQRRDQLWIANPLTTWTDADVAGYAAEHKLPEHPARARGAKTIGCVFCGGGAQYDNSGYRVLRATWPEAWRFFMVVLGAGAIILAIKYDTRLKDVQTAVLELGGLAALATSRPWVFDYTRITPLAGYHKAARGRA